MDIGKQKLWRPEDHSAAGCVKLSAFEIGPSEQIVTCLTCPASLNARWKTLIQTPLPVCSVCQTVNIARQVRCVTTTQKAQS